MPVFTKLFFFYNLWTTRGVILMPSCLPRPDVLSHTHDAESYSWSWKVNVKIWSRVTSDQGHMMVCFISVDLIDKRNTLGLSAGLSRNCRIEIPREQMSAPISSSRNDAINRNNRLHSDPFAFMVLSLFLAHFLTNISLTCIGIYSLSRPMTHACVIRRIGST